MAVPPGKPGAAAGLADNGGPTETVALLDAAANPALDHGAPGGFAPLTV
jgi:hypothetical protein